MKKNELRKWRENYTDYDGVTVTEGLRLEVHFEEKDYVKRIGARWNPDISGKGGHWYMPTKDVGGPMPSDMDTIVNIFEAPTDSTAGTGGADGLTRLGWLNKNKMINGAYGNIDMDAVVGAIEDIEPTEHKIRMTIAGSVGTDSIHGHFYVYEAVGVVSYTPNGDNPNIDYNRNYMTTDQAREMWNDFMEQGYRPVSQESS